MKNFRRVGAVCVGRRELQFGRGKERERERERGRGGERGEMYEGAGATERGRESLRGPERLWWGELETERKRKKARFLGRCPL